MKKILLSVLFFICLYSCSESPKYGYWNKENKIFTTALGDSDSIQICFADYEDGSKNIQFVKKSLKPFTYWNIHQKTTPSLLIKVYDDDKEIKEFTFDLSVPFTINNEDGSSHEDAIANTIYVSNNINAEKVKEYTELWEMISKEDHTFKLFLNDNVIYMNSY